VHTDQCTSALQPYPPFFSDFLQILQLLLLHDCQCYHIWKCVHRPCIYQHLDDISHFFLHFCIFYIYVSSLIANITIFGNVGTHHVYVSPPTSSLIFSDFLHILQLFFLHDCQCSYIWKCVHRPCIPAFQPHPSFFSDFSHILQRISSLIANITIFGNVRTDHVYISPPTSSVFFFLIFCIFHSCFSFMIANITMFGNVRTDHVHISPPTSSSFFFSFFAYFTVIFPS
jgi:hypothetical protein